MKKSLLLLSLLLLLIASYSFSDHYHGVVRLNNVVVVQAFLLLPLREQPPAAFGRVGVTTVRGGQLLLPGGGGGGTRLFFHRQQQQCDNKKKKKRAPPPTLTTTTSCSSKLIKDDDNDNSIIVDDSKQQQVEQQGLYLPFDFFITTVSSSSSSSSSSSINKKKEQPEEEDSTLLLFNKTGIDNISEQFLTITEPVQDALDGVTDGWALSYADLTPDTPTTLPGQAFLATNTAYLVAGLLLTFTGDFWFGFWTDMAAIASFNYHYSQLQFTGQAKADAVRLALVLDYFCAAISILTAMVYLLGTAQVPLEALLVAGAGLFFLYMSWIYEYGKPYMFWHSLWHLCSAYAGYLIGTAAQAN